MIASSWDSWARGGEPDVDGFIGFSLSVQNRRKSRAGRALENHLEAVFTAHSLRYERGAVTERNNKPDFLFPGATEYHDSSFPAACLTMLASKTSAKDRWRQILKEADRICQKHLITLEPAISEAQTEQMRASDVQLVIPRSIQLNYSDHQRIGLVSLNDFVGMVKGRARMA